MLFRANEMAHQFRTTHFFRRLANTKGLFYSERLCREFVRNVRIYSKRVQADVFSISSYVGDKLSLAHKTINVAEARNLL